MYLILEAINYFNPSEAGWVLGPNKLATKERGGGRLEEPIFIQQHSIFIAVAQYSMLVFFTTGLKTNYLPKIKKNKT